MDRRFGRVLPGLLLAMSMSSCTCQKEPPPPAPIALPTRPQALPTREPEPTMKPAPTQAPTQKTEAPQVTDLPKDFPSDVPVMEGAAVSNVQSLAAGAKNVLFVTSAPSNQIFSFYKDDLEPKGYKVTQEYQSGQQSFLSMKKGKLLVNVVIADNPADKSQRVIAVMYQEEEEVEEF